MSTKNSESTQLTIGMMPKYAGGQVGLVVQGGQVSADNLCEGLDVAVEMCHRIYTLAKKVSDDQIFLTYSCGIL